MKILVTGGAGFIGSHICRHLASESHELICIDSLISGDINNTDGLNIKFLNQDIRKPFDIKADMVFNMACPASPVDYQNYPIETLETNSLGMKNVLDNAKKYKMRVLQASTSEIYGDPLVHPQTESYWGNVNPVGPRSSYDEGKRYAEALCYNYNKKYELKIVVARIFNSILADQNVTVFNDKHFHLINVADYFETVKNSYKTRKISTPAFDPRNYRIRLKRVENFIKHPYAGDAFEITTSYGRKVKVTGDHSVFKKGKNGELIQIPARKLGLEDHIAIPAYLPVIYRDFKNFSTSKYMKKLIEEMELWKYLIVSALLKPTIEKYRTKICNLIYKNKSHNSKNKRNSVVVEFNRYKRSNSLPLFIIKKLKIRTPNDAKIRVNSGGAHISISDDIQITNDVLWLIGFFIAEGSANYKKGKSYFINLSSNDYLLKKAKKILEDNFGVHCVNAPPRDNKAPAIFVHSKVLYFIFDKVFNIIKPRLFPNWVFNLPLNRLKYVLEGFREGDGTHSGKKLGNELCFDTANKELAEQIIMLLLRFRVIGSLGEYKTTFRKKYGERSFPFYRITICKLSSFNILNWDKRLKQTLNARIIGDLVWAKIREIKKCKVTDFVYDFSVPNCENFMAGNGIFCHNTYGPKMRANDGRVIPNFINQALHNEHMTVYGDGEQTRSFCYIDDMADGLIKLAFSNIKYDIFNIGNPHETKLSELAELVKKSCKSSSKIVHKQLPQDDPIKRKPNIDKIKKAIGWEPKIALEDGLKKTTEYFKKE